MKNNLIVYYSFSGKTRQAAESLKKYLPDDTDIEELKDTASRKGILGFLKSGFQAMRRKPAELLPLEYDPLKYRNVILCAPVWGGLITPAERTYLNRYGFKIKQFVILFTSGSGDDKQAYSEVRNLISKDPLYHESLSAEDFIEQKTDEKMKQFAEKISQNQ